MDFESEIGSNIELLVTTWKDPSDKQQLGFEADARDFDTLLFKARTPEQAARDERRMEQDQWDFVPTRPFGRRQVDPEYGSLRIFRLADGVSLDPLVIGDKWLVKVISCSHNPKAPLTKDGRRKIRYSVRPIKRVEQERVSCDFGKQEITTEKICGLNRKVETIAFEARRCMYNHKGAIVHALMASVDGKPTEHYQLLKIEFLSDLRLRQERTLGKSFDYRRFAKEYALVPPPPSALLELVQATSRR